LQGNLLEQQARCLDSRYLQVAISSVMTSEISVSIAARHPNQRDTAKAQASGDWLRALMFSRIWIAFFSLSQSLIGLSSVRTIFHLPWIGETLIVKIKGLRVFAALKVKVAASSRSFVALDVPSSANQWSCQPQTPAALASDTDWMKKLPSKLPLESSKSYRTFIGLCVDNAVYALSGSTRSPPYFDADLPLNATSPATLTIPYHPMKMSSRRYRGPSLIRSSNVQ
jgi:hypothetical protein